MPPGRYEIPNVKTGWLTILSLLLLLNTVQAQQYPPPQNLSGWWMCDSTYVTWNPPDSGGVTGYNIYRLEVDGGEWLFEGWVPGDTDSFVVPGDPPFGYGLTALYGGGESDRAELFQFDHLDIFTFPPDRVNAVANADTIKLSWSSGQFGCGMPVGYDIHRKPEGGMYLLIHNQSPNLPRIWLDYVLDEGTWCYMVEIVTTAGSAYSEEVCATVASAGISGGSPDRSIPFGYELRQNYPNPFNPSTTISFDIPGEIGQVQSVSLTIHDIRGRRIRTLLDSDRESGQYAVPWDGRDDRGERIPSGVYLCNLRLGDKLLSRKMTLVK